MNQKSIFSIKCSVSSGTAVLKKVLQILKDDFEIKAASSIYKVFKKTESFSDVREIVGEEFFDGYAMAVLIESSASPESLLDKIQNKYVIVSKDLPQRGLSINLLVYEAQVSDRPGLTLPHPELHARPEELIPAAEVWPDYVHPILKESLSVLSRPYLSKPWGKFHLSAISLLEK